MHDAGSMTVLRPIAGKPLAVEILILAVEILIHGHVASVLEARHASVANMRVPTSHTGYVHIPRADTPCPCC